MSELVRAAGGLVLRRDAEGAVRLALVHRPKYDDWTLPKGKLHDGESHEQAALREVEEQTGYRCRLDGEVGSVEYLDRYGRPKIVRYWAMTPVSGTFRPVHEVDELRWVSVPDAISMLTYEHDRNLLVGAQVET
jgi:8-oxo-dGTP pyrophosphatase MutT (NUDIX family)